MIREREFLELVSPQKGKIVFVSCLLDRVVMCQCLVELDWKAEAWRMSDSGHTIHFNGEGFMGSYEYGVVEL